MIKRVVANDTPAITKDVFPHPTRQTRLRCPNEMAGQLAVETIEKRKVKEISSATSVPTHGRNVLRSFLWTSSFMGFSVLRDNRTTKFLWYIEIYVFKYVRTDWFNIFSLKANCLELSLIAIKCRKKSLLRQGIINIEACGFLKNRVNVREKTQVSNLLANMHIWQWDNHLIEQWSMCQIFRSC